MTRMKGIHKWKLVFNYGTSFITHIGTYEEAYNVFKSFIKDSKPFKIYRDEKLVETESIKLVA